MDILQELIGSFTRETLITTGLRLTPAKRVFNLDMETCRGAAKVIACTEDPVAIKMIPAHIEAQVPKPGESVLPASRASPQARLFS